jgi:hypothetical protein
LPLEVLRVAPQIAASVLLSGLYGWPVAAYEDKDTSTPPCEKPFGHLADIESLPGKLRAALGG